MSSPDQIFINGPVIAIRRNPADLWQALSVSENAGRFDILRADCPFPLTPHIADSDLDVITRKLGATVLQRHPSVLMRYRIRGGAQTIWVEDHCSLTYHPDGEIATAESLLWISTLPLEWHLLVKGSETWNALNSKIRHDMLNQLTAILGYLELSEEMEMDPILEDFSKKEQSAAEKIREKLIFTREYQKIGQTEFEWVKLNNLLTEVAGESGCRNLPLILNIPDIRIFADKMLKPALISIFENIPEHAPQASRISVDLTKTPTNGILSIQDDGPGIPEEHKTRIFDLGFGSGGGLGLFLAEKLLGAYGIILSETGTSGSGTRLELDIPGELLRIF